MHSLDIFILSNAAACFGVYLLAHMTVFRFVKPERIIAGLMNLFAGVAVLNGIISIVFLRRLAAAGGNLVADLFLAEILSFIILGMMCFLYVIGIFGPYETSVRIRLIRELQRCGSNGASLEEILKDYRDTLMVKERIKRLVGSGELIYEDGFYRIGKTFNIFSLIDNVTGILRKIYGRPEVNE